MHTGRTLLLRVKKRQDYCYGLNSLVAAGLGVEREHGRKRLAVIGDAYYSPFLYRKVGR